MADLTPKQIAEVDELLAARRELLADAEKSLANIQQNIDQLKSSQKMYRGFVSEGKAAIAELEELRGR